MPPMINTSPAMWRLVLLKNDEYDDEEGVKADDGDDDVDNDGDDADAGGGLILSCVCAFEKTNFVVFVCDVYLKYFLKKRKKVWR